MYVPPKTKLLYVLLLILFAVGVGFVTLQEDLFLLIISVLSGLLVIFALFFLSLRRETRKITRILDYEMDPDAFLQKIGPILQKATTVEKGLFQWKNAEALAWQLLGDYSTASRIRAYLLTIHVQAHEKVPQLLLKGQLAIDLLREKKLDDAKALWEQMNREISSEKSLGIYEPTLRELRCLWEMVVYGNPTLYQEFARSLLSNPKTLPLELACIHFHLGEWERKQGNTEAAKEHFLYVAEKAPKLFLGKKAAEYVKTL